MWVRTAGEVALLVGAAAVIAGAWVAVLRNEALHRLALRTARTRARRAHYAAIEAAEDDPFFSPEAIAHSVVEMVALADCAWRAVTDPVLGGRADAYLIGAWARSRECWLGSGLRLKGIPAIDLLSVVNRPGEDEDRVVVRVRIRLHCKRPRPGSVAMRNVRLDERWTLGRYHDHWVLLSVDGDPVAGPILTAPLIPNRSFDNARLLEESLAELANAQKVGDDTALSGLVGGDEAPSVAVLDLSVLDGRFLPPLIAAALAHLLEAWELAVTGSQAPLEELASSEARAALLTPSDGMRLIVRDMVLKSWTPTKLELSRRPPAIAVALTVEAVRYVLGDDDRIRFGSNDDRCELALRWILELTDSARTPWRLASSNNPAEAIARWL